MATIEEFSKLDIRIGRVVLVEGIEKARKPVYKLTLDFGPEIGRRAVVAGIASFYSEEELEGRQIACIVNLEPKIVAGVVSEGMILAADDGAGVALLVPEKELKEGSKIR